MPENVRVELCDFPDDPGASAQGWIVAIAQALRRLDRLEVYQSLADFHEDVQIEYRDVVRNIYQSMLCLKALYEHSAQEETTIPMSCR